MQPADLIRYDVSFLEVRRYVVESYRNQKLPLPESADVDALAANLHTAIRHWIRSSREIYASIMDANGEEQAITIQVALDFLNP